MVHQSTIHDRLVALLRRNPQLICELWQRASCRSLPLGVARIRDTNLRSRLLRGKDRHLQVDVIVTIHADAEPESPALFALVVEVQLRPDPKKLFTWVEYLAAARREYRCAAEVLVFSPRPRVIRWAHRLFTAESHLRPRLFGQDQIPVVDDESAARAQPVQAILAAVFHAKSDRIVDHAAAAVVALNALPAWLRPEYIALLRETIAEDVMDKVLEKLAREAQEEADEAVIGTWAYNRGRRRGHEEGLEEGRLQALRESLWLLVELRGLAVDEQQRATVESCCDSDQLHRWLIRLKTAERFAGALDN
ncbi:MAG: hypothetical protein R6X02_30455 [Enhygromyxa sp.]